VSAMPSSAGAALRRVSSGPEPKIAACGSSYGRRSFPRSRVGMQPVTLRVAAEADAERPMRHSHAERGNDHVSRAIQGRISDKQFGHIDPLLAAPAVLSNSVRRKTVSNRISLRRIRNADDLLG